MAIQRRGSTGTSISNSNKSGITLSDTSDLTIHDFITLSKPKKQGNILIHGDTKTWKTSFCTRYAPGPIAFINLDGRAEHAIFEAMDELGQEIYYLKIDPLVVHPDVDSDMVKNYALNVVKTVEKNFEWAVEQSKLGNVRTICIDTATEYSEIVRYSFDGVLTQTKDGAFGKDKDYVNGRWWKLFKLARSSNAHFIITSRSKEIWAKNDKGQREATGRFTYRCPPVVAEGVDYIAEVRLKTGITGRLKPDWEIEIQQGVNVNELGKIYDKSDWEPYGGPFTYACWKQFERTSNIEDWM